MAGEPLAAEAHDRRLLKDEIDALVAALGSIS